MPQNKTAARLDREIAAKSIRRAGNRPANPNDVSPNAALSAHDVHFLVYELEYCLDRIRGVRGREIAMRRRHARKLIDKLRQVRA